MLKVLRLSLIGKSDFVIGFYAIAPPLFCRGNCLVHPYLTTRDIFSSIEEPTTLGRKVVFSVLPAICRGQILLLYSIHLLLRYLNTAASIRIDIGTGMEITTDQ